MMAATESRICLAADEMRNRVDERRACPEGAAQKLKAMLRGTVRRGCPS